MLTTFTLDDLPSLRHPVDVRTGQDDVGELVSLADIAKLGRVSRPAVSNWRRRYEDFPQPVQETGARSLFRLAEVEHWMRRHGKRFVVPSVEQRLWSAFNAVRGDVLPEDAAQAGMVLLGLSVLADRLGRTERKPLEHALWEADGEGLTELLRRLAYQASHCGLVDPAVVEVDADRIRAFLPFLQAIYGFAGEYGDGEVFEALMAAFIRDQQGKGRGEFVTPPALARLMISLAEPISGTVYDPACGVGGLLFAAYRAAGSAAKVRLVGQETHASAWGMAKLRMLVHDIHAEIVLGDTLAGDADLDIRADVVLADPPLGMHWRPEKSHDVHRWPVGAPPPGRADLAWLQHSISRLRPTGLAFHVTAHGPLFRAGAEAEIRRRLIASGCVHAIIALPPGTYANTAIPVALWIVGQAGSSDADGVFLLDASRLGHRVGGRTELTDTEINMIVERYRRWQSGDATEDACTGSLRHATVTVARLLEENGNLLPAHWLHDPPNGPGPNLSKITVAEKSLRSTLDALTAAGQLQVSATLSLANNAAPRVTVRDMVERRLLTLIRTRRVDPDLIGSGNTPLIRGRDLGDDWSVTPSGQIDPGLLDYQPTLSQAGDVLVDAVRARTAVDQTGGAVVAAPLYILRSSTPTAHPLVTAALIASALRQRHETDGVAPRGLIHALELPLLDAETTQWLAAVLQTLIDRRRLALTAAQAAEDLTDGIIAAFGSGYLHVQNLRAMTGKRP